DFNINSIKNLEAANPLSGVVRPEGFEASSFGDASFRFTLPLTAGRAGLTPSVAVVYSSGGGNGICGIGFDVQYGSVITTDTRQGLPKYDGNDTYVKDGTILRCIKKGVGVWEYEPKKKTVFEKIERHRNDEDDWWVVYEKNGIKKYYGNSPDSYSCAGGSKRAKFSWYLTKEEDRYGNTIVYTYEKDEEYVYPTEIRYTGHGRERGRYFVSFGYDKKLAGNYIRPDVRTDGRGKFLSVCGWRLTEISTNYEHQENGGMTKVVLKRFCFKYAGENDNYDAAWVSLLKRFEVYS
ncbi:SpvB/TcaC N-terminal domain-containing protein, partial [Treponema socranskii]|uniref:SpvB/TcaC N-terminal domain-containing protein n=1 Tax=Treponema socranskii TaxID=53419 RepID=UPI003D900EAF